MYYGPYAELQVSITCTGRHKSPIDSCAYRTRIMGLQAGFSVSNEVKQHLADEQGVAKQTFVLDYIDEW